MNQGIVSLRYAKALLKFSLENEEAEKVYLEMSSLAQAFLKVSALKAVLLNPVLTVAQKLSLLTAAATTQEVLSRSTKRFLELLVEKQREALILFVAQSYIALYRQHQSVKEGTLTLAFPISEKALMQLKEKLQNYASEKIDITVQYDPSIMGGFIFEYDSKLLDASVKNKLSTIYRELR